MQQKLDLDENRHGKNIKWFSNLRMIFFISSFVCVFVSSKASRVHIFYYKIRTALVKQVSLYITRNLILFGNKKNKMCKNKKTKKNEM